MNVSYLVEVGENSRTRFMIRVEEDGGSEEVMQLRFDPTKRRDERQDLVDDDGSNVDASKQRGYRVSNSSSDPKGITDVHHASLGAHICTLATHDCD